MSKLVSKQLVDFVKSFEGFSATKYLDEVGIPTLGYGMTGKEIEGLNSVTEEQAANMLEDLLNNKYANVIKVDLDSKGVTLNQNQFDALVSMAYNVGTGGVLGSTLYKNICSGIRDVNTITSNFTAWSYAGGRQLAGLLRRRQDEAKMFFGSGNTNDVLIENVKDPIRIQQIKALQYNLNLDYNAKLKHVDGNIYQETLDALNGIKGLLVKGSKSNVVLWLKQKLIKWGYIKSTQSINNEFTEELFQAITILQKNWGRATSGILELNTWNIFLNNK
ncbi:lysozyme [Clostridium sp. DJ247]|uniref:lysozyme n=1 Tax=Clostridium sp. DJ247 TaxID=2726188 RepID=UPI001625294A|nr:lysozyme [Clostridium sp. DJ247]